ncbi:MAG TPA: hypothetical protein VF952_02350 [Chloroflexia bacterium]|jgi:hypothetical protein
MHYSAASDKEAQAPARPYAYDHPWWRRLLPLLSLVLGLATIGIYYVPAYPDLALPVTILLLSCTASLITLVFYIFFSSDRLLKRSDGFDVEDVSPALPVARKHLEFRAVLIPMSISTTASATIQMVIAAWTNEYSFDLALALSLMSFLSFSLVAIPGSRRNRATIMNPWMSRPALSVLPFLAVYILMMISSGFIAFQAPRYLPAGPAASWPRLLEFARTQAARIDKDVVLSSVRARIMYDAPEPHTAEKTPMSVDFHFLGSSKGDITVEVLDADPPRLRRISNPDYAREVPDQERVSRLELLEGGLKLSPREVYELTEQEAQRFAQEKGITLKPSLVTYLDHNSQQKYGVPVIWEVRYYSENFDTAFSLIVDASTGKVLQSGAGPPS